MQNVKLFLYILNYYNKYNMEYYITGMSLPNINCSFFGKGIFFFVHCIVSLNQRNMYLKF